MVPSKLQVDRYAEQVAALGFGKASVQSFALHADPPVAHPQGFPAPSVVALHAANVFKL